MTTWDGCTFLYRFYNNQGRLLYVGISADPEQRTKGHHRSPWFREIAAVALEYHASRSSAKAAESEAIRTEWPLWNRDQAIDQTTARHHDLQRYQELLSDIERFKGGKPMFPPLYGAAKRSHEARKRRLFAQGSAHAMLIDRLIREAMIMGWAAVPSYLSAQHRA